MPAAKVSTGTKSPTGRRTYVQKFEDGSAVKTTVKNNGKVVRKVKHVADGPQGGRKGGVGKRGK